MSASAVSKPIFDIKFAEDKSKVNSLKREQNQERLPLKEFSRFEPLRKGRSLTVYINHPRQSKTGLHLHPVKSIKNWRVN